MMYLVSLVYRYYDERRDFGKDGSKHLNAGGKVPMEPKSIPVTSPEMRTVGVRVRVKVPIEKGTVCPSIKK